MLTLKLHELSGHDVYEIMHGKYKGEHWLESSIFIIHDFFMSTELEDVLLKAVPFNPFGPTEITISDWETIKKDVFSSRSEITKQLVSEIDKWTKECFKNESCFTICGP